MEFIKEEMDIGDSEPCRVKQEETEELLGQMEVKEESQEMNEVEDHLKFQTPEKDEDVCEVVDEEEEGKKEEEEEGKKEKEEGKKEEEEKEEEEGGKKEEEEGGKGQYCL
ncbi:hypothetical protein F2P79_008502 [Pimephales promelas]|nr:hypothetical protein F2P79_008502 [Pimephales promelas]